ncbi:hypothetical protein [Vibrio sp. CB1-14]|uniref:Uncharacterized protein n=1 Tax=Vibrio chaetopteri TaxID=3016528 RepID=A0AAU8BQR9_9VIBR
MVTNKQRVIELLVATKYGVSASEMPTLIDVPKDEALGIINELISEGENIHSLGDGRVCTLFYWCHR